MDGARCVDKNRKGQAKALRKFSKRRRVIMRSNAVEFDALVFVLSPDAVLDVRDLGRAYRSPGGKVGDHHRMPQGIGEGV